MTWSTAHLDQDSEEVLVLGRAPPRARVLPVKVQPVEVVLAQEFDDRGDEGLAVLRRGHHGSETAGDPKRAGEGLPPQSQHLVVTSNSSIFASKLFTRIRSPNKKTFLVFSCPLLVITAMAPQCCLFY